jgi:hypothetical protein
VRQTLRALIATRPPAPAASSPTRSPPSRPR